MNDKRYRLVLYVIVFVILGTISMQVYWNYKNYLVNKQQLINDVQLSLDNAVETYYANLAENNTYSFTFNESLRDEYEENYFTKGDSIVKLFVKGDTLYDRKLQNFDIINPTKIKHLSIFKVLGENSIEENKFRVFDSLEMTNSKLKWIFEALHTDSTAQRHLRTLTSKVILSLTNNTLLLKDIDTLLKAEFKRKKIAVDYGLTFKLPHYDSEGDVLQQLYKPQVEKATLSTVSKSAFLPRNSILKIHFSNATKIILKRILSGILISLLLVIVVISCLFYLLKIIKHQKQLAEVKNDLISNITHEFKTPIATISVALESIKNFNVIDNKEKTKTYLDMSKQQLTKLNIMVEKLLDTATLDSNSLKLVKEECNINDLLHAIIDKHQIQITTKTIDFIASAEDITASVDTFHFENAINNIIDNAVKYGGETITVHLKKHNNRIEISISDNGTTLTKAHKDNIFEQFYRVPKGNTHDVKGFGIGLYYAKKIIEKHDGSIHLNLNTKLTTFTISLPNEG